MSWFDSVKFVETIYKEEDFAPPKKSHCVGSKHNSLWEDLLHKLLKWGTVLLPAQDAQDKVILMQVFDAVIMFISEPLWQGEGEQSGLSTSCHSR